MSAPSAPVPARGRRRTGLTAAVALVSLTGFVLAVLSPEWLTTPLRATVAEAGPLAPAVFVLLCAVAAPAHLLGLFVSLSMLVWPVPEAALLSVVGGLLGTALTAALLVRLGAGPVGLGGPAWLRRVTAGVARRPVLVSVVVRVVVGTGAAVEAFHLAAGYRWRQYVVGAVVGTALRVARTVVGVSAVAAVVAVSPWLGAAVVGVPLALAVALALRQRRRARARAG